MIRALLWDVDGTLAETERDGHRRAFNQAFADVGVPWRWGEERYGALLAIAGGRERLLHDMQEQAAAPASALAREQLVEEIHRRKNQYYQQIVRRGELPLRAGVAELLADCAQAGVRVGVVTTTTRSNAAALLDSQLGASWEALFAVVVCAEEAPRKKPDPQAYQRALATLGLRPHEAVAVEDSPAGLQAAWRAGVPVLITRSHYFLATAGEGALAVGRSLGSSAGWLPAADATLPRVTLTQISSWYANSDWAARTH